MSFYLRKSLRAGPFRLNLSKSGIGVSAGVPGFRVGTGPRGNYIHAGRHGIYYRSSLGKRGLSSVESSLAEPSCFETPPSEALLDDRIGPTTGLGSSAPSELIEQLNAAESARAIAPVVAIAGGAITVYLLSGVRIAGIIFGVGIIIGSWWLHQGDLARRTVPVFYDVNDGPAARYQKLSDHFDRVRRSERVWRILSEGKVKTTQEFKVNAGAGSLVERVPAVLSTGGPRALVTNIAVPSVETKAGSVYVLPDRVLLKNGKRFSQVDYAGIHVATSLTRFIESGYPPGDSKHVGTTWKYVNVKGGPDRRFKNNRQIPILQFGQTMIEDVFGTTIVFQFSDSSAAEEFASGILEMRIERFLWRRPRLEATSKSSVLRTPTDHVSTSAFRSINPSRSYVPKALRE